MTAAIVADGGGTGVDGGGGAGARGRAAERAARAGAAGGARGATRGPRARRGHGRRARARRGRAGPVRRAAHDPGRAGAAGTSPRLPPPLAAPPPRAHRPLRPLQIRDQGFECELEPEPAASDSDEAAPEAAPDAGRSKKPRLSPAADFQAGYAPYENWAARAEETLEKVRPAATGVAGPSRDLDDPSDVSKPEYLRDDNVHRKLGHFILYGTSFILFEYNF